MPATAPGSDAGELRELVREVLHDLLPALRQAAGAAAPPGPSAPPQDAVATRLAPAPAATGSTTTASGAQTGGGVDQDVIELRSDADLDAFVRRLFALFDNPKHRADILTGRRRFRLGSTASASPSAAHRVDRGAVTETQVKQAAAAGARLVLGRRAVLTPLARDRARALGVVVEKER